MCQAQGQARLCQSGAMQTTEARVQAEAWGPLHHIGHLPAPSSQYMTSTEGHHPILPIAE